MIDGIDLADRQRAIAKAEADARRQASLDQQRENAYLRDTAIEDESRLNAAERQRIEDARYEAEQKQRTLDRADASGNRYLDTERRTYDAQQARVADEAENERQRAHALRVVREQMAPKPTAVEEHNPAQITIDALDELSTKINTAAGLTARAGGVWASAAARANFDDDVAEYTAVLEGAIPSIARKMGHVGVLTELDVQSVRNMFPKVGDSKTLRDRKMSRIRSIMNMPASNVAPPPVAPAARNTGGNKPAVFGELRTVNGVMARWDGRGWIAVQ